MAKPDLKKLKTEDVVMTTHHPDTRKGGLSAAAEKELTQVVGVEGFGYVDADQLIVYVSDPRTAALLPDQLEGKRLKCELIGSVKAY